MPRSPLITQAANDLARYFNTTTEASFIDQTWGIRSVVNEQRAATVNPDVQIAAGAYGEIARSAVGNSTGKPESVLTADLLNGAMSVGSFLSKVADPSRLEQLSLYRIERDEKNKLKVSVAGREDFPAPDVQKPSRAFDPNGRSGEQHPHVYMYAANVLNPFLGPTTRDVGSLEIFMNAIPTLEFSKCVPYMSIDIISLLQTAGTVAPPLTLIGFLNPSKLGSSDTTILNAQGTQVASEVMKLGAGIRSGMELFTAPQTLVNLGATGPTFVPVIDRMRPLATLGNLSLSTKIQGGTMNFTTGRLEITILDRSRLREVATFVRPDLYGTTFLDITYGWSHPEGGLQSRNAYGKFLDALKVSTRFRIAGSSYSFEEGGQVKVTLNIQTVGSTDLLYLGPKGDSNAIKDIVKIIRRMNDLLAERRSKFPAASMADYDFLSAFQDPTSALTAASDKDAIQKARKLIQKLPNDAIVGELKKLLGKDLTEKSEKAGGELSETQRALIKPYDDMIDELPAFGAYDQSAPTAVPDFGSMMPDTYFNAMSDNTVYYTNSTNNQVQSFKITSTGSNIYDKGASGKARIQRGDFVSFGSVFMKMVAEPIKESGQYDEVQVVFYPFNKYAGAVHDLPISAFPVEKERFKKAIEEVARRSPSVSCRQIIGVLDDRFTGFLPSRAYLMAGFYNQSKAESGEIEANEPEKIIPIGTRTKKDKTGKVEKDASGKEIKSPVSVAPSVQLTFEERLNGVGIPERRFTMPQVQVYVEGAPLVDDAGTPLLDERNNPKSIIKIHVYDAAMDPHSTISDIVRAAKDNELGIIVKPIANINANTGVGQSARDASPERKQAADKVIDAGVALGILKALSLDSTKAVDSNEKATIDKMRESNIYYEVAGGYDSIKQLVMAGMPYITYGTSTSAISNATLSSNTSAGLGNVQLLRAFTEPGEAQAENLNSGVPMLVVPGQLSISTVGCPLFSPMQRLFIDFGTGTSIDNVYYVLSMDSTIGKDGFKTDVKLAFADAFAQYRSLNQNLALLAKLASRDSEVDSTVTPTSQESASANATAEDANRKVHEERRRIANQGKSAGTKALQALNDASAKLDKKLREELSTLKKKIATTKKKVEGKIDSIVPEETKIQAARAKANTIKAERLKVAAQEPVEQARVLTEQVDAAIKAANDLPADEAVITLNEIRSAIAEITANAGRVV